MEQKTPVSETAFSQFPAGETGQTGKLKIFFSYSPGAGKRGAMLKAAQRERQSGADVVIGFVDPGESGGLAAEMEGMERLPFLETGGKGVRIREFDLDGALRRHPQLILVEDMAHINLDGSRHRKRYQDVEELLRSGIHVYTTLNVQNLESLNDLVFSVLGRRILERVPDRMFDGADQVEMVDIEPKELLLGSSGQEESQPMKNLEALREMAFRRCAERLNRGATETDGFAGRRAGDPVMVCLSAAPSNEKVVREAARLAEAFHSSLTALLVETQETKELKGVNLERLKKNMKLAEQLGASIVTVYGDDVPVQVAEYAKASGVSKIVLGRTNHGKGIHFYRRSLVERLTRLAPNLDVYIIPDNQPRYVKRHRWNLKMPSVRFSFRECGLTFLVILGASAIGSIFKMAGVSEANIITIYLLGVLLIAIWTEGRQYSVLAAFLSVIVFNFLYTEPRFTLRAYDSSYPVTFLVMLLAGFLTSSLATRIKTQAAQSARKAYRTEVLLETSQRLQKAEDEEDILEFTARQIYKLLECRTVIDTVENGSLERKAAYPLDRSGSQGVEFSDEEKDAVEWVYRNNKQAGATTNTFGEFKTLFMAIRGKAGVLAVAGISMDGGQELDAFERNLLLAILDECGLALDKERLRREKLQAEMAARQETLRANLLRAISHDLRTPLTSITGNAGILMENEEVLTREKRHDLYGAIYDDSMWLYNLVENLLSVTRIENGTMHLKMEPELLDEVFHEALSHLDRRVSEHRIQTVLADDLLMARMDVRLVIQVIINIVNNAIKYTPPGSTIEISARGVDGMVEIRIADNGPGIPQEAKKHLFKMFYTADNTRGDGRRGMGLGLSLCQSIVNAHGGKIWVEDNQPHGAVFCFQLKAVEVN